MENINIFCRLLKTVTLSLWMVFSVIWISSMALPTQVIAQETGGVGESEDQQEEEGEASDENQEEGGEQEGDEGESEAEGVEQETESNLSDIPDPDDEKNFATEDDLGEEKVAIIDRDPFDRLTFDEYNKDWELDIDPIELEDQSINSAIDPTKKEGRLVFTMPDYPGRVFATPWSSLVKIDRYVDLVMAEADQAMKDENYDIAFKTLIYLAQQPDFAQKARINQMMDKCIYEDGEKNLAAGRFGEAMASFEELFNRSPQYKVRGSGGVIGKITTCYDQFVEAKVAEGDYQSARRLLVSLREEYGANVDSVIENWETEMRTRAIRRLQDVRKSMEAGDGIAAHDAVRDVLYVMPTLPEATKRFNDVVEEYPYVLVGVTQLADKLDVRQVENWGARRIGYMVNRWLTEYKKPGDDGGIYEFPSGRITQIDELGVKYRMTLSGVQDKIGVPNLQSYEITERLFDLAEIDSPEYYIPWARLVDTLETEDEKSIVFTLKYPHVAPEALITLPYFAPGDNRSKEYFGIYRPIEEAANDQQAIFKFNDRYEKPTDRQHPDIIERLYENSSDATEALLRGYIDVVDRIYPGDINRLKSDPMIGVEPYLLPSVHMLIPNPRTEAMKSDQFRRAIHFAINRPLIIKEHIAGGRNLDGFEVVSGPFPIGTDNAAELGYGYNERVKAREYSPTLGLVLSKQYVVQETIRQEQAGVQKPDVQLPTLILAHPDVGTIRAACRAIQQQWKAVGIECELRALPKGQTVPEDDEYDLLYAEVQMQEPLIDAYRIFGRNGLAKMIDPTIDQALRNLDKAFKWSDVSSALQRVHEQCANNLTILPLWQVVDHYAYRKNVFNLGEKNVFLYQDLNDWRIDKIQPPTEVTENK